MVVEPKGKRLHNLESTLFFFKTTPVTLSTSSGCGLVKKAKPDEKYATGCVLFCYFISVCEKF